MESAPFAWETDRRDEIVLAAAPVFLRFGFRKTSMGDLAQAAQLSRQGLYLHFPNKELLFREVITHLGERVVGALRAALARVGALEARLLAGFEDMTTVALANYEPAEVRELFGSAADVVPEELAKIDERILDALAGALHEKLASQGARSRRSGEPSPRELAEHLYVVSYGLQQRGHTGKSYRARMTTAVHVVCTSGS